MTDSKTTYIHETESPLLPRRRISHRIWKDKWVVYNTDQLIKDLPFIINQVIKENKKMQEMYLDLIKEELKEL